MSAPIKYTPQSPSAVGDLRAYLDQEFRKIQNALASLDTASSAVEGWTNASFAGGWSDFSVPSFGNAGFFKDPLGMVHLRGLVANGGITINDDSSTVFTLPIGYRPAFPVLVITDMFDGTFVHVVRVRIEPSGIVHGILVIAGDRYDWSYPAIVTGVPIAYLNLNNIHFRAEL